MEQRSIELLFGSIFIIIHAYTRFNTPPTNRASTTAVRYHTSAASYFSIYLCIYYILTKYPSLLQMFSVSGAGEISGGPGGMIEKFQTMSPPLLVALLLTVLLPKIPLLSNIDKWLIKHLQELAAIPYEVRRLSRMLRDTDFESSQDMKEKVGQTLKEMGFESSDILFDRKDDPKYLWTKIAVLMTHLDSWEGDRKLSSYMHNFSDSYKALRDRYKNLSVKAKKCFRLNQDIPQEDGHQDIRDAIRECNLNFAEQGRDLLKSICDFISQGVLTCSLTHGSRCSAMCRIGFKPPESKIKTLTVNQVLTLMVVLFFTMLLNVILNIKLFGLDADAEFRAVLLSITMIAITYTIAVVCAIYPKDRWKFTRRDKSGTRPMLFYLTAGFAAVILASPIGLFFNFLIYLSDPHITEVKTAFDMAAQTYKWLLITFVTGFVTAFHTDNRQTDKITLPRLRWIEGISQSILTMFAGWIVVWWINDPSIKTETLVSSAIKGFIIGFIIPNWYRAAPHEKGMVLDDNEMIVDRSLV